MMQIQKGQVKYKDRTDIICTYGVVDGKQYYFLDGEKLGKGRIVASTVLVEAIDPLVLASNIGVLDEEGNVVIPFENKAVKPVADKAMIVEVAKPVTPSVIEAANLRRDPLAATRLVTTPAAIKEKVNAKMGVGGRFLFNDQFSEASVYDLDGNNLLDGKLYSFIGYNDGVLYLAGNTAETEVVTYSLNKEEVVVEKPKEEETLDVKDIEVSTEDIDKALGDVVEEEKILHPIEFKDESPKLENSDFPDIPVEDTEEEKVDEKDKYEDTNTKEVASMSFVPTIDEGISRDNHTEKEAVEEKNEEVVEIPTAVDKVSLFEHQAKHTESPNEEIATFENRGSHTFEKEENIIEDTAEVMAGLIDQNKKQKDIIAEQERQIDSLLDFKKKAFEENKTLVETNEALKKKLRLLEKESLSNDERVTELEEELNELRMQVSGKDDLARLVADAKNLLGETE